MSRQLDHRKLFRKGIPVALALSLAAAPMFSLAQATPSMVREPEPSILAMYTDLLILRPVGICTLVIGSAAYIVSLPFTLPVGGATQAGKTLVADPAKFTFARCLGCTRTGYNKKEQLTSDK
jgi:hypothetical protein